MECIPERKYAPLVHEGGFLKGTGMGASTLTYTNNLGLQISMIKLAGL